MLIGLIIYLYFLIWYFVGIRRRDFSVFDVAWGSGLLLPIAIAAATHPPLSNGKILLLFLVIIWAVRLTFHLSSRYMSQGKDQRYKELESPWGNRWRLHGFFKVFLLQATFASIIILPELSYMLLPHATAIGPLSLLGVVVALVGFRVESIADSQLKDFKSQNERPPFFREGLWKYSRHPNYVGEVMFWWGLWLFCAPHVPLWTIVGPLTIHLLIRYVSGVPLIEKRWKEKSGFEEYANAVPIFWPCLFRRKSKKGE